MRSLITRPRALAVLLAGTALTFSPVAGTATAKLPVDQLDALNCVMPTTGAAAKGGRASPSPGPSVTTTTNGTRTRRAAATARRPAKAAPTR
jgi:hypothetical protein